VRFLIAATLTLAASTAAVAQSAKSKDYESLIEVGIDPETGAQVATSINAAEVKSKRGYSVGAQTSLVFWVEARKPVSGPTQVVLAGERLRYIVPDEAPQQREFGPSDPKDPVSVGSPWKDADLRYRGSKIECISSEHWCAQIWFIEIILPDAVVRSAVAKPSMKDLPIALSKPRRVDWRIPRQELVATLDKLGVLAEFSQ
jgi:hypothetical protein